MDPVIDRDAAAPDGKVVDIPRHQASEGYLVPDILWHIEEGGPGAVRVVDIDRVIDAFDAVGKPTSGPIIIQGHISPAENAPRLPDADLRGDGMQLRVAENRNLGPEHLDDLAKLAAAFDLGSGQFGALDTRPVNYPGGVEMNDPRIHAAKDEHVLTQTFDTTIGLRFLIDLLNTTHVGSKRGIQVLLPPTLRKIRRVKFQFEAERHGLGMARVLRAVFKGATGQGGEIPVARAVHILFCPGHGQPAFRVEDHALDVSVIGLHVHRTMMIEKINSGLDTEILGRQAGRVRIENPGSAPHAIVDPHPVQPLLEYALIKGFPVDVIGHERVDLAGRGHAAEKPVVLDQQDTGALPGSRDRRADTAGAASDHDHVRLGRDRQFLRKAHLQGRFVHDPDLVSCLINRQPVDFTSHRTQAILTFPPIQKDSPLWQIPMTDDEIRHFTTEHLYVAALCDILDGLGHRQQAMHHRMRPILPDMNRCGFVGRARTVRWMETDYIVEEDPYGLEIEFMDSLGKGDVVVHSTDFAGSNAPWGELMTTVAKQNGAVGCVCDSRIRDVIKIVEMNFPVFCAGIRPLDSMGRGRVMAIDVPIRCGDVLVHHRDWIVADYDGVVVIPQSVEEEAFTLALEKVNKENLSREDLLAGKTLREVFTKHGVL